ncbi:type I polyketide synthase, partial [Actinoplanes sp. GCM10030250]|uniref:type I polyketide synthase n=1 Tax=Actinoplanes sp. GCM10030250 TaxID=3273376 RepID=UPI00361D295D
TAGVPIDWQRIQPAAVPADLPTYPFERQRYWLRAAPAADAGAIGQTPVDHPLLRSAVRVAGTGDLVLTGRLAAAHHPWLAEHVVHGTPLVPGSTMLELAAFAATAAGCDTIAELTLQAPLVLPADGDAALQVTVGAAGDDGLRPLRIHSQQPGDDSWTPHAEGTLSTEPFAQRPVPPDGDAEELPVAELYTWFAAHGFEYGEAYRVVRAARRRGGEMWADLEPGAGGAGYGIFPPLLDGALHFAKLPVHNGPPDGRVPFSFSGVRLHVTGAAAARAHVVAGDSGRMAVTVADEHGAPLLSIGALTVREPVALRRRAVLHQLTWTRTTLPGGPAPETDVLTVAGGTREAVLSTLTALQDRLADDTTDRRLMVVTSGAVALDGEIPDPGLAAVWGLVRSAQAEHPDRFLLADIDGSTASRAALAAVAGLGEPQVALRAGTPHVPRLTRITTSPPPAPPLPDGTVLITGATGALGRLLARHLVTEHGATELLLVSRHGAGPEQMAELTALGARVTTAACDVADRAALAALLAGVPALSLVVHAAGVLADATISNLTAERVDTVLRAKADAAAYLDELTRGRNRPALLLFSSVAGVLGSPGQAGYAAANAYLDALAQRRAAQGHPATAMAWGWWDLDAGMTAGPAARRRDTGPLVPLTEQDGLALFDAAWQSGSAAVVTARLRPVAGPGLPPVLRDLAPAVTGRRGPADLTRRLAAAPEAERGAIVRDLVRDHCATILGLPDRHAVKADRGFLDMGFDSLTAVELRNRLGEATGLRLPATLLFDNPTPAGLAEAIHARLAAPVAPDTADLDRIEANLADLGDGDRDRLAHRLRALLDRLTAPAPATALTDASTDDELFAFIDDELGIS